MRLSWTRKAGETALQPLLFADVRSEVRLGAGAVRTEAQLSYRILRAGVNALEVLLPAAHQVLSVEGQTRMERSW